MLEQLIQEKGIGKPISEEDQKKLKKEIAASKKQAKRDSSVDVKIMGFHFNS